jgi:serine/threonine protein kinase
MPAAAMEPDAVTLTIDNLIHVGTNSSIFQGRRHDDHQFLVTKLYDRTRINSQPELADRLLNERRLLEAASKEPHAFIVGFKCALVTAQAVCICMENVGGGDLFTLLERHGPFAPEHARIYVGEVALAVGHLHALDIIHRSLTVRTRAPMAQTRSLLLLLLLAAPRLKQAFVNACADRKHTRHSGRASQAC